MYRIPCVLFSTSGLREDVNICGCFWMQDMSISPQWVTQLIVLGTVAIQYFKCHVIISTRCDVPCISCLTYRRGIRYSGWILGYEKSLYIIYIYILHAASVDIKAHKQWNWSLNQFLIITPTSPPTNPHPNTETRHHLLLSPFATTPLVLPPTLHSYNAFTLFPLMGGLFLKHGINASLRAVLCIAKLPRLETTLSLPS